jgi:hypothetical protein
MLGLNRLVRHDHRREIVIGLLSLVWVFNVLGVVILVASLVAHSATQITGSQLLASGGAVCLTNATAFSPTDALPLTRPAKALMAAESTLSVVTVLHVAARAVNILI